MRNIALPSSTADSCAVCMPGNLLTFSYVLTSCTSHVNIAGGQLLVQCGMHAGPTISQFSLPRGGCADMQNHDGGAA